MRRNGPDIPLPVPEHVYRTIFENTGTAMCLIEEDTTISLCNEEFAALAALPREEIEGKKAGRSLSRPRICHVSANTTAGAARTRQRHPATTNLLL